MVEHEANPTHADHLMPPEGSEQPPRETALLTVGGTKYPATIVDKDADGRRYFVSCVMGGETTEQWVPAFMLVFMRNDEVHTTTLENECRRGASVIFRSGEQKIGATVVGDASDGKIRIRFVPPDWPQGQMAEMDVSPAELELAPISDPPQSTGSSAARAP